MTPDQPAVAAPPADDLLAALAGRLRVAARTAWGGGEENDDPAADVAALLDVWTDQVAADTGTTRAWLLLTAVAGRLPVDQEVRALVRLVRGSRASVVQARLLEHALGAFSWTDPLTELDPLIGEVVVDVDFTARHDLSTGIQRVVRQVVPRWSTRHPLVPVAWSPSGAMRRLDEIETARVLAWRGPIGTPPSLAAPRRVVVPWQCTVVLPEVPAEPLCPVIAALAEHSGNAVSVLGYDAIPVVSADLLPPAEPERFVHYLTVVKHATTVSAISGAAGEEFAGFVDMLPAQGLDGPRVEVCALPVDTPADAPDGPAPAGTAQVLVVGSHEPRKNHLSVLYAAEVLWREGLAFELTFVGGPSWASGSFYRQVDRARRRHRPVQVRRRIGDGELMDRYRLARFSVFASLHEGYGLPVAESLAVGTPAVTSDVGSMAEIGRGGGVLMVDPRDDESLVAAMRRLLVDDALRLRLHQEALARPRRSWDDYATESWQQLVDTVAPGRAER